MHLTVNGVAFARDACDVSRELRVVEQTPQGIPLVLGWTWTVTVFIRSEQLTPELRQADFALQELQVRNLLLSFGLIADFAFWSDNPFIEVASLRTTADCVDGIRFRFLSAPGGQQDFVGNHLVRFAVQAEYYAPGTAGLLIEFNERVASTGTGGPMIRNRLTLDGLAIRQQIYPNSMCQAAQSGRAVGWLAFPTLGGPDGAAPPLWPDDELVDKRNWGRGSPMRHVNGFTRFEMEWSYTFERVGQPFQPTPHFQP